MQHVFQDNLSAFDLTRYNPKYEPRHARYKPPPGSRKAFVKGKNSFLDLSSILAQLFAVLPVLPEQFHQKGLPKGPCESLCCRLLNDAFTTVFGPVQKGVGWRAGRSSKIQADIDWLLGNSAALNEDRCLSSERCCTALGIDYDCFRQQIQKVLDAWQSIVTA